MVDFPSKQLSHCTMVLSRIHLNMNSVNFVVIVSSDVTTMTMTFILTLHSDDCFLCQHFSQAIYWQYSEE